MEPLYSYDRTARLVHKYRKDKDRKEWAFLESDGPQVLKWFGTEKPSEERVLKEERRIQFFKHHASVVMVEHHYGQWKDETGRWAVDRVRGDTEQFTARDRKGRWKQTFDSLSAALEALHLRAKNDISLQMEHYSYERRP